MEFALKIKEQDESFHVIDTHTVGEPTRIILEGFPMLHGSTMMEKKEYLEKNYDHYRTALMLEPRGHRDMFGALITDPICKDADIGVIFMESAGYLTMCGHGSIGTVTAAVELGLVDINTPYTEVILESPAGMIRTEAKIENGKAVEVSFLNVPSFLYKKDLEMEIPGYGTIKFDISFGGNFFALIDADKIGLELNQENVAKFKDLGMKVLDEVNRNFTINHPSLDITEVALVEFYGKSHNPDADLKNLVVFGDAQVDRSPCGTGTSAKLAQMYEKNAIGFGEELIFESITGSIFRAAVIEETDINGTKAIIPKITGRAYITGSNQILLDSDDPNKYGFLL